MVTKYNHNLIGPLPDYNMLILAALKIIGNIMIYCPFPTFVRMMRQKGFTYEASQ